jgi:hypothetical protein
MKDSPATHDVTENNVKNTETATPQFETPAHLTFHKSKPALIKTLFEPQEQLLDSDSESFGCKNYK